MARKVVEREINGFKVEVKKEKEYGFVRISKDGKSVYVHICPEIDGIYINTIFKNDFRIKCLDDTMGIMTIEGFSEGK
jgi:hypothetical protein